MVEKTVSVRRRSKNKVWFNEDHGKFKLRSLRLPVLAIADCRRLRT